MSIHVIRDRVPTPEEMGEILGLTSDRVKAVRRIMNAPVERKNLGRETGAVSTAQKKATGKQVARRSLTKK